MTVAATACVTPPRQFEIDTADVGPLPDYELARDTSEEWLLHRLGEREPDKYTAEPLLQVDARTADIHWEDRLRRGWYVVDASTCFGWQLTAAVNARNAQGELTGPQPWSFWFHYGALVATAEPSRMGKAGSADPLWRPILLRRAPGSSDVDAHGGVVAGSTR